MHVFQLWAPKASGVEVVFRDRRLPMESSRDQWWTVTARDVEHGTEYAFSLDGGDPLPDPRSHFQPTGVHGFSAVVDHTRFEWTDTHWQARPLPSAVIYEMHTGTFTPEGTFESAIAKLGYLVELGITHLEIMPVNEFSGTWGWGYDGVDLYAPHHVYGGPDGLKKLVNAAHEKGLAVLLDVVYNHLGPAGNYLSRFGPYFTTRHATPWGEAINLDGPYSHEVRRFLCDNALMWLRDYHFDGLRIDAVHALIDSGAMHFLEQLALEVEKLEVQLGRHLVLIAESDLNDPRIVRPRETGGYGIDAQWSDDFHHALHSLITGETSGYYSDFGNVGHLAKALKKVFVYDGSYSPHRQRPHGRRVHMLPGYQFLGYSQNHDQVGNRMAGRRIWQLSSISRAKVAAGIVLTSPFVPMLFQGEEWATSSPFQYFTSHDDPELGEAVSEGRRREFVAFGWKASEVPDPQDEQTYRRSQLNWNELSESPHSEMLGWYRTLLRIRRQQPSLTDGNLERLHVRFDEQRKWIAVERGPITAISNFHQEPQCIPVRSVDEILLSSSASVDVRDCGIWVEPDSFTLTRTSEES